MHCRRLVAAFAVLVLLPVMAEPARTSFQGAWRWIHFTTASGLPSNVVTSVVDIPGDGVWARTRVGVARFDGFRWHEVPVPGDANTQPTGLVPDGTGGVAVVVDSRLLVGTAAGLRTVPVSGR